MNFKIWLETDMKKEIILLRGVSATGKSTLAKQLVGNGVILSTDDYFMKDGMYDFGNPVYNEIFNKFDESYKNTLLTLFSVNSEAFVFILQF